MFDRVAPLGLEGSSADDVRVRDRPTLLQVVDPDPAGDRVEPGAEPEAFVETIEMPEHPDEGLLGDVLGDVGASTQSDEESNDRLAVRSTRASIASRSPRFALRINLRSAERSMSPV